MYGPLGGCLSRSPCDSKAPICESATRLESCQLRSDVQALGLYIVRHAHGLAEDRTFLYEWYRDRHYVEGVCFALPPQPPGAR